MSKKIVAILFAVLLWTAACQPLVSPTVDWPLNSAEVDDLLRRPLAEIKTLSASGTIALNRNGSTLILDVSIALIGGKGARFDVFTPFFTPMMTVVVTEDQVIVLEQMKRRALLAPATPEVMSRQLNMRVDPHLLMEVLAGGASLDGGDWTAAPAMEEDENGLWIYENDVWRVGIDPEAQRIEKLIQTGESPLICRWSAWQKIDGMDVPRTIQLSRPLKNQSLRLKMSDVEVNQTLDGALLSPEIPADWDIHHAGAIE